MAAAPVVGAPVRVGDVLELECARLALEGKGVCLLPPGGYVVLVERALPGEGLRAEVTLVKRGYAEARKLERTSPPRDAVEPPCAYAAHCGGCTLQGLAYEAQLGEKRNQVEQTLRRVGRLGRELEALAAGAAGGAGVEPVAAAAETFEYRNKTMFRFSSRCWLPSEGVVERPALGLLRPGSSDLVLPVTEHGCLLQDRTANALLGRVWQLVGQRGMLPYNDRSGRGFLSHLVIRRGSGIRGGGASPAEEAGGASGTDDTAGASAGGGEYLLVFGVTRRSGAERLRPLAAALAAEFPGQLAGVVSQLVQPPALPGRAGGATGNSGRTGSARSGNSSRTSAAKPDADTAAAPSGASGLGGGEDGEDDGTGGVDADVTLLHGRPYIHDVLHGRTFRISPASFFQTNSRQAERLYDIVREAAELRPTDVLLDLYCGTGTIGLSLADACREVVGVDVVESAIQDARRNAALNGITNATFVAANVDRLLPRHTPAPPAAAAVEVAADGADGAAADDASAADGAAGAPPPDARPPGALPAPLPAVRPDVVIVDPARGGLGAGAVALLAGCGARRVVYVSCNVATQARDLSRLVSGPFAPYRLLRLAPLDMFPHTDHVECVAVLERVEY